MTGSKAGRYFLGVDIQQSRNCPYAILSETCEMISAGWIEGADDNQRCDHLLELVEDFSRSHPGTLSFGIDSPRAPRETPRNYYVDKQRQRWVPRGTQLGYGRHCETIIHSIGIATPQWTPLRERIEPDKQWIETGAALFRRLGNRPDVYEVFPSASYSLLAGEESPKVHFSFSRFAPGPKDMLDAIVAAITVREYLHGNGCDVGNADGLGSIILPRDVIDRVPVFMRTIPAYLLEDA